MIAAIISPPIYGYCTTRIPSHATQAAITSASKLKEIPHTCNFDYLSKTEKMTEMTIENEGNFPTNRIQQETTDEKRESPFFDAIEKSLSS